MEVRNVSYRLRRQLAGIKLESRFSETGVADFVPTDSVVSLLGPAQFFGMVEVQLAGDVFAIFEEDLKISGECI